MFDFLNIYSKFMVLYMDEYLACNHEYILFAIKRLFTMQALNCTETWICGGYTPIYLLSTMSKFLMELAVVLVWPQKSGFVPAWNFFIIFFQTWDFEFLGISAGLIIKYIFELTKTRN